MLENGMYLIIDAATNKFYVGSCGNTEVRFDRHIRELKANEHHCLPLQQLWNSGTARLTFSFFPTETREDAYVLEKQLLDAFATSDQMLNIQLGTRGGDALTRHPNREAIIAKITVAIQKRMEDLSPLERKALFGLSGDKNGMWGKTHTLEVRQRISEANRGRIPRRGFILPPEQRQLLSDMAKLRVGELNPFYGKKHSDDTKQRISEAKKNQHLLPPNTRKVEVDGMVYESLTEASRQLNISPALVVYRLNSEKDKYKGYCYLT
jgi:group I intron endonuclease